MNTKSFVLSLIAIFIMTGFQTAISLANWPANQNFFQVGSGVGPLPEITESTPIPALLTLNSKVINITDEGFTPLVLTVDPGTAVTWHNATSRTQFLMSGKPSNAHYASTVNVSASIQPVAWRVLPHMPPTHRPALFGATLEPGEDYTYTFLTSGQMDFFLANAPYYTGQVIVKTVNQIQGHYV